MGKFRVEIKWAVLFTIFALLWMLIEKLFGWHDAKIAKHATYTNIFAIIAVATYVFALLEKRRSLGGVMSWKEGFISGLIISVIVALLTPISQYITHNFISPSYFTNAINYAVESGEVASKAEAETFFNIKAYIMFSAVGALIMGLITAAIVAFFVKKEGTATV